MFSSIGRILQGIFFTRYHPDPGEQGFQARRQSQTSLEVEVSVAVPDAAESERLFGVPLARRGLQPVHIRVLNHSQVPLRLHFRSLDPHYYPPLEAAARCHFSLLKRFSAYGIFAWYLLPLLLLAPFKLYSAHQNNLRMDSWFQFLGFHRRPISPGETAEGFVFTQFDAGTKMVRVRLMSIDPPHPLDLSTTSSNSEPTAGDATGEVATEAFVDLTFTMTVPGINADYLHKRLDHLVPSETREDCDIIRLLDRLKTISVATCNRKGNPAGDPVNLVVIGEFETLLNGFSGRWDETEVISLNTCWKTARSFLLGSEYRYSPVSPLYLFGRSQDIALQQIRQSISTRLHLRLWLAPLTLRGKPVWVGQVSRDIGVRFTTKTWNLTTHRVDPDVDESRDYVLEDLLDAERVEAAGYVDASSPSTARQPRRNLTGDPYYTDGKRVVILLGDQKGTPRFIRWD